MEIWKDIEGYEGDYQASSEGRIKSLSRFYYEKGGIKQPIPEAILKQTLNKKGYMYITLRKDCLPKTFRVHRLVAAAFIQNIDAKPQVNHKNGIKSDNRVENLEWCNNSENQIHSIRTGLRTKRSPQNLSNWHKTKAAKIHRDNFISKRAKECQKLVLNTQTGIFYESAKEAHSQCEIKKHTFYAMLNGNQINKTSFIYA